MKARLILDKSSKNWILEKIAAKLAHHLDELGVKASVGDSLEKDADVHHYVLYHNAITKQRTEKGIVTMGVTHVDDPVKVLLVKDCLSNGVNAGVCMSSDTVAYLVSRGVDKSKLCFISPAHDGLMRPRKIKIGITSNLYEDGRKREFVLLYLAQKMDLSPFHFEIFGKGWEPIRQQLQKGGATVDVFEGSDNFLSDYEKMIERVPLFDYYLYPGMDEGSLGTLDALAAGVKTIVTPQGFHLDLPNGISHSFVSKEDLFNIFSEILKERNTRLSSVANLTWRNYAQHHIQLWTRLLSGDSSNIMESQHIHLKNRKTSSFREYYRMFNKRRIGFLKYYILQKLKSK